MPQGKCHPSKAGAPKRPSRFFFPGRTAKVSMAKAVKFCQDCPVKAECLKFAVESVDVGVRDPDVAGVFGGKSPQERVKDRKALREEGRRK